MKRPRPSGHQKRKLKKAKVDQDKLLAGSLSKYLVQGGETSREQEMNIKPSEQKEQIDQNTEQTAEILIEYEDIAIDTSEATDIPKCDSQKGKTGEHLDIIGRHENENACSSAKSSTVLCNASSAERETGRDSEHASIYSDDAANWPMPLPDHIRLEIIKQGSETYQHKEGPFVPTDKPGENSKGSHRSLKSLWFYSTLSNGTKYLRKWMVYSPLEKKLYCFCCRLFATEEDINKQFVSGFNQWWKLNPKISEHESSSRHLSTLEKWKTLAVRLKIDKTIDKENQIVINQEAKKWRTILYRLLDITLFLAQQNLAFRGHREDITSENRGNFLELVNLMGKYDPALKELCLKLEAAVGESKRVPSYLSKSIQNEFIFQLGEHVKKKIVADVKKSKYFGIIFDSTPDVSRTDQMSQVIRYVHIEGDVVEVRESFLGFFSISKKTASEMTKSILQQLEKDGLDIKFCRAQGYDNAASMSGVHGGVQQKIRELNPKALFTPCANHSLNLCGVHSFSCVPSSVTFFGTLERLYSFFSVSTHRWEMLSEKVGRSLKRLSDTRWNAHHDSVKAVTEKVEEIVATLEEMCDPSKENLDTRSAASLLIPALCDFTFLSYLHFWNTILKEVNLSQKYLQMPKITLDMSLINLKALDSFLKEERTTIVDKAIDFGTQKCAEMGIDIQRRGRRKLKKTLPGELSHDAGLTLQDEVRRSMFECVDRFAQELRQRSSAMNEISNSFNIVQSRVLMEAPDNDLESAADKLNNVYDEFQKKDVIQEVKRFRRHIRATNTTVEEAATWSALDVFQFIIKWDFSESLPNISLILKYFLTVCVSVSSCERSFSKLKLIKNYLRSTMTEDRLNNLAILSIERKVADALDFDVVIDKFSKMKARKHVL